MRSFDGIAIFLLLGSVAKNIGSAGCHLIGNTILLVNTEVETFASLTSEAYLVLIGLLFSSCW